MAHTAGARTDPALQTYRNEVVLVGELAAEPVIRTMPSGDEVTGFRLTIRSGSPPTARAAPRAARRSDSVECAAWTAVVRRKVARCRVGDLVEVTGALRHRYWRGPAGLASRYEVEAASVRVVVRASVPADHSA
jgi:single-strand DNA-binding protein